MNETNPLKFRFRLLLAFLAISFLLAGWAAAKNDFNAFFVSGFLGVVIIVGVKENTDALCDLVKLK